MQTTISLRRFGERMAQPEVARAVGVSVKRYIDRDARANDPAELFCCARRAVQIIERADAHPRTTFKG